MGFLIGMVYTRMANEKSRMGSRLASNRLHYPIFFSNTSWLAIKTKRKKQ